MNQCQKQAFNSPRECLCDMHNMCKYICEWTHADVCNFYLRVMFIFMQHSYNLCYDLSCCKLLHLCERALYPYYTDTDTSPLCPGTHRCNLQVCSWLFKYMVNAWLEDNIHLYGVRRWSLAAVCSHLFLFNKNCGTPSI